MNDHEIVQLLADEIAAKDDVMELVVRPVSAFQLAGLIQLALRHPHVSPEIRTTGEHLLGGVRHFFADCPTVLEVIRRGDDPHHDR